MMLVCLCSSGGGEDGRMGEGRLLIVNRLLLKCHRKKTYEREQLLNLENILEFSFSAAFNWVIRERIVLRICAFLGSLV